MVLVVFLHRFVNMGRVVFLPTTLPLTNPPNITIVIIIIFTIAISSSIGICPSPNISSSPSSSSLSESSLFSPNDYAVGFSSLLLLPPISPPPALLLLLPLLEFSNFRNRSKHRLVDEDCGSPPNRATICSFDCRSIICLSYRPFARLILDRPSAN